MKLKVGAIKQKMMKKCLDKEDTDQFWYEISFNVSVDPFFVGKKREKEALLVGKVRIDTPLFGRNGKEP